MPVRSFVSRVGAPGAALLATAAVAAGVLTGHGDAAAGASAEPSSAPSSSTAPLPPPPPVVTPEQRIASLLPQRLAALHLGSRASVVVTDVDARSEVLAVRPTARRLPASLSKLATTVAALETMGPDRRFVTSVLLAPDGTLVLRGGGDATLRTRDLGTLAAQATAALGAHLTARRPVVVDDSVFAPPTLAPGWPRSYYRGEVSPVRGLVVDRAASADTGMLAGRRFAAALERRGVQVTTVSRRHTPAGSTQVASFAGLTLAQQVKAMLQVSDNDIAETLGRQVALAVGERPDWAGAERARASVLARLGVPLDGVTLRDGSGLSRLSRITPYALVSLLDLAADPSRPELSSIAFGGGLPVAGRTGSLRPARGRFVTAPSKCATGKLWAKTGLLRDVVGLAGYTRSTDGHLQAFAVLVNGSRSTLALRRQVDGLAATVTGCW
ncbi:D-alanyl-D-alanine carboxypeptidase/D-alanyl-D-alanine-endopeptidase (penicillin-binding protein 4) [Motilibacter peucedani]|uniref:D-alanyl-D-alanine carboxypeptidase/D-alanyl-D-alanine-endopeptidase (Penicillin-binding protein 4) n=1 Tax=Motilibacter peucedani TaxID=598650 RepID=A0A420XPD2_9ACTN|nr:D-alanyl-D-alanine carboxypeptidase/D-alanyl-D-alanine-endopeptidase [Motilibacter peucedani]RKS74047.1 D-alanyl-D-alanine carboxypeptidase/D-alanyl-D-alanine-endopeptidase (penicillin-binding protein 4) [Motilibacter peucedani]